LDFQVAIDATAPLKLGVARQLSGESGAELVQSALLA
jgi:hypothetical protein